MKPYSGEALSPAQATQISVCDGCAFFLGCAFGGHVTRFIPSSLRSHDVFVHGGSPFDSIVSQLLPGVIVDLFGPTRSLLTTSLKRRWGQPIGRLP